MATYVLIHGAGSDAWYWHLVAPLLEERGHEVVTMNLPVGDESAGLAEYTQVVLEAIGDRGELVVVGQSLGGFVAPLVAEHRPVELLVLLNAMVPRPGETDWWAATGIPWSSGPTSTPSRSSCTTCPTTSGQRPARHAGPQAAAPMREPHPLQAVAGRPDALRAGAPGPLLPRRLAARCRPRSPRHRARRDRRWALRRPQPPPGAGGTARNAAAEHGRLRRADARDGGGAERVRRLGAVADPRARPSYDHGGVFGSPRRPSADVSEIGGSRGWSRSGTRARRPRASHRQRA